MATKKIKKTPRKNARMLKAQKAVRAAQSSVTRKLVSAQRRISMFAELWDFLRVRKKWWLGPPLVILLLLGLLLVFAESSAVAPFIYTLF